jgi:serine/threonine protein kinase
MDAVNFSDGFHSAGRFIVGFFDSLFGKKKADPKADAKKAAAAPAKAPPPKKKPIGPKVNIEKRFNLIGRIGQGSMSKVWRAVDNKSGRNCCLKVLDKPKTDALKKRFVGMNRPDEGEVAMSLNHPNIVRTLEWGLTTKGEEYLVMEMVEGVGLNFLIDTRDKRFVGNEFHYLIQMAEAVQAFHDAGYIHRDICPRNVMVTNEDVVKLIDFGLAVPNTPTFRRPGNRTGTAAYMAPELIKRAPTDLRLDLFSLGVTVYESFTYQHPWENIPESLQAMLNHINAPPRDPRELKPGIDEDLAEFLLKGVAKDPSHRFQTGKAYAAAMEEMRELLASKAAR